MGRIKDFGYDPRLAEDFSARQERLNAAELQRIAEEGAINAEGITDLGNATASIIDKGTQGYVRGDELGRERQAHQQRMALSDQELKKAHAEDAYWNTPQSDGTTRRDQAENLKMQREQLGNEKLTAEVDRLKNPQAPAGMSAFQQGQLDLQKKRLDLEASRSGKEASSKTAGATKVTSGTAQEVGSFDSALDMANQLESQYNKGAAGAGSSLKSFVKGTDADKYETFRDYAAQTIGTILEKGKLTDRDYDRYKDMMPKPSDTNGIAAQKMTTLKNLILAKKRGEIGGLTQAGFDTSGFDKVPEAATSTVAGKTYGGTANAAPAMKAPEEMTPEERAAELRRLRGQ